MFYALSLPILKSHRFACFSMILPYVFFFVMDTTLGLQELAKSGFDAKYCISIHFIYNIYNLFSKLSMLMTCVQGIGVKR